MAVLLGSQTLDVEARHRGVPHARKETLVGLRLVDPVKHVLEVLPLGSDGLLLLVAKLRIEQKFQRLLETGKKSLTESDIFSIGF